MAGHMTSRGRGHRPRWRIIAWGTAAAFVLLPLRAMQVTDEVKWGVEDFIFATVLVGGVGLADELAAITTGNRAYRTAVAVALGAAFLLIWVNAAVGIIGSEDHPANRLYSGVLIVGLLGAAVARLRPHGMALALVATALAQILVFLLALVAGWGFTGPITVFFTGLWLISAWLFERAVEGAADR